MKSWKVDSDCCSWDGVTCDTQNGEVIGLDLSNSWLNGHLKSNSSLFSLHHLRKLNLTLNNFSSSTIPSEFGQLVIRIDLEALAQNMIYLRELHLDDVNISSSLPQYLANLSSLTSLSLSGCHLQGKFPTDIFLSLKELHLHWTNFSGEFSNSIDNLGSLNVLDLSRTNLFGELPNSISNLKSMNCLNLDSSNFSRPIPPSIGNLSQLTYLSLSYNNSHGQLPSTLGNLKSLNYLNLDSKNINSTLPKFSSLSMSSCNLTEFPDFLKAQNELKSLDLSNNNIEGHIPKWFWNVGEETLQYLNLSYNCLSKFEQPSVVLPWKKMYLLDLSSNMLQGSFPIPPLSTNYFFVSKIILPEETCLLVTLDLNHNQIHGKIPRSLVKCKMLEVLNLGNNKLNDTFPFWLESLPELRILVLRENRFHGPIWDPHVKFGLSKLHVIDLSHNNFLGNAISRVTGDNKSQLGYMGDTSNYYKDSLTIVNKGVELELVKILTIFTAIDLSDNRFYGEIPDIVGNLKALIVLNLSSNNFMSHIPSSLGNLVELA
ncbi:hypothetical protein ACB098_03G181900 [Castanea mollissima]